MRTVGGREAIRGDWRGAVLFFAGTAWDGNRFPDQHIAERLTRHAPVIYVDPPLSIIRAGRRGPIASPSPVLQRIGPRLARVTPIAPPWPSRAGVRLATFAIVRRAARQAVRALGADVAAVVTATLNPVLGGCPAPVRVLYGTDDFVAGAELMGVDMAWLRRRERQQLQDADLVIAVSDVIADKWRSMGAEVTVVPNGCDVDRFSHVDDVPFPPDVTLTPPIVGFVGHLSERIDLELLEALADRGPSLLLVGPRQPTFAVERIDGLLRRPNVQWVGAKPFDQLAPYLRAIDVGVVPYADSPFNRASFPLKTLEYLAAGRPTVATDLPAIRWLGTDVVSVASGATAFADAVDDALTSPLDPQAVARRRDVAAANSWDARAEEFAARIGIAPG